MQYEWDENKAAANVAKHGIAFDEAITVFDDPLYVDFYGPDHSYEEHRFILLGQLIVDCCSFLTWNETIQSAS
jgi:uncharacterized protein